VLDNSKPGFLPETRPPGDIRLKKYKEQNAKKRARQTTLLGSVEEFPVNSGKVYTYFLLIQVEIRNLSSMIFLV